MQVIESILLLRAGGKGLLQAILFGLATVLLFKGFWLWLTLAIILAIVIKRRAKKQLRLQAA